MITVKYIENLGKTSAYYLFSNLSEDEMRKLDGIAVTQLAIKESGFGGIVKESSEFAKLLEVTLNMLGGTYSLYLGFIELSPKKKSKLRSHKGIFYGLKKLIPEENFFQKEFNLQDGYSQFGVFLHVDLDAISFYINNLLFSNFSFGLIMPKDSTFVSTDAAKEQLMAPFLRGLSGDVNYYSGITSLSGQQFILFKITTDGQDNQYLEFYAPRQLMEAEINKKLLPRLRENFHLRHPLTP